MVNQSIVLPMVFLAHIQILRQFLPTTLHCCPLWQKHQILSIFYLRTRLWVP